jgi:hypothetical protein
MPRLLPRLLALLLAGTAISACAVYPDNRPYDRAHLPHDALYGPGPGWRPGWEPSWGYRPGYAAHLRHYNALYDPGPGWRPGWGYATRYGRHHRRHYDDD